jgi:hypothetical protein
MYFKKSTHISETSNVLVAPVEMLVEALNSHLNLQRYKILSGSKSSPAQVSMSS